MPLTFISVILLFQSTPDYLNRENRSRRGKLITNIGGFNPLPII